MKRFGIFQNRWGMGRDEVRINAVWLWNLVNASCRHRWSYGELKEKTRLSDLELSIAIGWLLRENTLEMECNPQTGEVCFF